MQLRDVGEFRFIERITEIVSKSDNQVLKGIGDDCAVVRIDDETAQVVTTDALVEGIHFLREHIDGEQLGHKSLAVSLSDVAAMGARPTVAVVTIAAPSHTSVTYLESVYQGMQKLADRTGVTIVGGDTTRSTSELVISVTVLGAAPVDHIRYRSDARSGDALMLAGVIGESGAGLHLLQHDTALPDDVVAALVRRHLEPEPLLGEGVWLAKSGRVGAMMDVSDGIASDVGHICSQSSEKHGAPIGVRIQSTNLPISESLAHFVGAINNPSSMGTEPGVGSVPGIGCNILDYLLRAGEDYALLFTTAAADAEPLMAEFRAVFDTPIAHVGEITSSDSRVLIDDAGNAQDLGGGHDHYVN
jgi:thiamine-monophosphate kinase